MQIWINVKSPVITLNDKVVAAARNEGPSATFVSLRMGGDECQLPSLQLIF